MKIEICPVCMGLGEVKGDAPSECTNCDGIGYVHTEQGNK